MKCLNCHKEFHSCSSCHLYDSYEDNYCDSVCAKPHLTKLMEEFLNNTGITKEQLRMIYERDLNLSDLSHLGII